MSISKKKLEKLNENFFMLTQEDRDSEWSGCDYQVNQGDTELTPKGTA